MATRRTEGKTPSRRRPPVTTPEAEENQLINAAIDLAYKQIQEGTASSQVITHFLKLGSSRERKEQARIEMDIELAKGKREQMASMSRSEDLMKEALAAFREYSGQTDSRDDYDD